MRIGSLLKLYTLLLLSEKPRHGYELLKDLKKSLGKIGASQVYPFLKTLLAHEIIKVSKKGTREKKIYRLTRKGRRFVLSILDRLGELVDIAVKPRLKVCLHCGCKLYEEGYTERIKSKILLFCCHHCARSYKRMA